MVTIHVKKYSGFEAFPELEGPRQTFNDLENLIQNHLDTTIKPGLAGSFLAQNTSIMKRGNLNSQKFEESQQEDEGNGILETTVAIHPYVLNIRISLQEIGILEGRGSYEVKPSENGLWLFAQELDMYKNSVNEEAHAVKRNIARCYAVNGCFDWRNMVHALTPDGALYISVKSIITPDQLNFPLIKSDRTFSSLPNRLCLPPSLQCQNDGWNSLSSVKCCNCGGVKSVGVQTGTSLLSLLSTSFCADLSTESGINRLPSASTNSITSFPISTYSCNC